MSCVATVVLCSFGGEGYKPHATAWLSNIYICVYIHLSISFKVVIFGFPKSLHWPPPMSTKGFIIYLLSSFSVALLSALFLTGTYDFKQYASMSHPSHNYGSGNDKVWPVCHTFIYSLSRYRRGNEKDWCFLCWGCRNWRWGGELRWPQLLGFWDLLLEPLEG